MLIVKLNSKKGNILRQSFHFSSELLELDWIKHQTFLQHLHKPSCKQEINIKAIQETWTGLPRLPGSCRHAIQSSWGYLTGSVHVNYYWPGATSPKILTNTFNSPYLRFTLSFPPKLNQLLLTSQILRIGHSPTWSVRIKNLLSDHQLTSIPFSRRLTHHPVLFISIVIILVQSFNHPFNKYILNTYNMLNAIYQVLC